MIVSPRRICNFRLIWRRQRLGASSSEGGIIFRTFFAHLYGHSMVSFARVFFTVKIISAAIAVAAVVAAAAARVHTHVYRCCGWGCCLKFMLPARCLTHCSTNCPRSHHAIAYFSGRLHRASLQAHPRETTGPPFQCAFTKIMHGAEVREWSNPEPKP